MKKLITFLMITFCSLVSFAQGLENIIVEKYYISDGNDTTVNASGGILPVGSVTYRIFVDMLPGYKFQAAYGTQDASGIPLHTTFISTSTLFFNNEDRGATTPTYSKTQAKNNTVMLDSWLSVGAAATGNFGIPKADDDGVNTVVNADAVLQNTNPLAGNPLTSQDGLIAGTPEPVTIVGINTEIAVFDNQNDGTNGPLFSTSNGSWASLNGSTGPNADNKVLIAQITTDGTFAFELNIQLGTPIGGGVENYVARNPTGNEIYFPSLTYSSLLIGLNENSTTSKSNIVNVFPNPVNGDYINLEVFPAKASDNNSYKIYDLIGNVVAEKTLTSFSDKFSTTVDVSNLNAGQYFFELNADGVRSVKKVVKF